MLVGKKVHVLFRIGFVKKKKCQKSKLFSDNSLTDTTLEITIGGKIKLFLTLF